MNLYDIILQKTKEQPESTALVYFGFPVSYGRLGTIIEQISLKLHRFGIKHGDIVSLALPTTPESIALLYALNKLGVVVCTIDVRYTAEQVTTIVNKTHSKMLFIMNFNLKATAKVVAKMGVQQIVVLRGCEVFPKQVAFWYAVGEWFNGRKIAAHSDKRFMFWSELLKTIDDNNTVPCQSWNKDEAQLIFQTSGTTGTSKSVLLTAENIEQSRLAMHNFLNKASNSDTVLSLIPLFAFYGFLTTVHLPLSLGMKVVIIPIWKPCNFINLIKRHKPQHVFMVPSVWDTIYEASSQQIDLSSLKTAVVAGDVMSPGFERDINSFLKANGCSFSLTKAYGMTETAGVVAVTPQDSTNKYETGFSGQVTGGHRVEIIQDEVCVCPSTKFLGYYQDQEATDHLIRKHDDGLMWIHTGDIGHFSDKGDLFVVGRKKRMIVRHDGTKVFPIEIETALLECPEVKSCAVVGATDSAHKHSSVPIAFVVMKTDRTAGKENVHKYCKQHLPIYLQPEKIVFLKYLPTTDLGKVDYSKLSET